jgi:hypothetical protein
MPASGTILTYRGRLVGAPGTALFGDYPPVVAKGLVVVRRQAEKEGGLLA